jgi:drug/metabolite transporter (DMT)-like permease
MNRISSNIQGVGFLVLAMLIFSLQDIAVKWIGGDYPVLEIVTFRSLIALPLTLLLFRYEGGQGLPTTQRHTLEYIRGLFYFLSYTTHFMGLAALPLAEIAAIKFSGPLMITVLSVVILGEAVGPRRWLALLVGFMGVLLIVRPGVAAFNIGSIFILISVLFYALAAMLTRKLQTTDSSATMAYFSSLVYLIATCILTPLVIVVGDVPDAHPSVAFLFRPWAMPSLFDWAIMSGLGLVWAGGMYCVARAYSLALASVVAPFEYIALPINVMWGFVIWRELPPLATWAGAALTLLSGMYILYREQKERSLRASLRREKAIDSNDQADGAVQRMADQITRITKETNQ